MKGSSSSVNEQLTEKYINRLLITTITILCRVSGWDRRIKKRKLQKMNVFLRVLCWEFIFMPRLDTWITNCYK